MSDTPESTDQPQPSGDASVERLVLSSLDVEAGREAVLRELFPEAFLDNRFDLSKIALHLSVPIDESPPSERYGLSWAGKADAMRAVQVLSTGTLHPNREESVDFDSTRNIMIEGDNLEVLKLLQRSYYGKVKMIYIDPPYNTGKDFIYPDNYREGLETYLKFTGQVDAEGYRLVANTETDGRYHSKWLSMMYPRLALARNLLRRDGAIFVSIDDHEVHNLRHLLDETFGPENYLATLVWDRGHSQQQGIFKEYHEYVVVYARYAPSVRNFQSADSGDFEAGALKKISKKNPASDFTFPAGVRCEAPDGTEFLGKWGKTETVEVVSGRFIVEGGRLAESVTLRAAWTQPEQMGAFFNSDEPVFDTKGQLVKEFFFNSTGKLKVIKERGAETPPTVHRWGTQGSASKALADLFDGKEVFDRPKPVGLVKDLVRWMCPDPGDIALDFFAGSCTTGEAVMRQCADDGIERRFICVDLPFPTEEGTVAHSEGYATTAAIGAERLRRVSKQLGSGRGEAWLGHRFMSLGPSNFRLWNALDAPTERELAQQLLAFAESVLDGATDEDLLFEILLKSGVELSTEFKQVDDASVYVADGGRIIVCLERPITEQLVDAIVERRPERVVFLDRGFESDADKANAAIALRKAGVEVRVV